MQTRTYRDHWNRLNIKSTKPLTINGKNATLSIHTSKTESGHLTTSTSVSWPSEDGKVENHAVFQDFYKTAAKSKPARVTEKVANEQHQQVLQTLNTIEQEVAEHYKAS